MSFSDREQNVRKRAVATTEEWKVKEAGRGGAATLVHGGQGAIVRQIAVHAK